MLPSSGCATLMNRHNLASDRQAFLSMVGYCPQSDPALCQLTGRQMTELLARLRGMAPVAAAEEAQLSLDALGLTRLADRQCGSYSGGTLRRLSLCLAMVGEPPLLLLDEPSAGVDIVARRNMWNVIRRARDAGQAVLISSHRFENILLHNCPCIFTHPDNF